MSATSMAVLQATVLGPLRHNLGRSVLSVLAIALGIALGLSIYLINRSAADEISLAARSLYGLADLAVEPVANTFDETLYPRIARLPGVQVASPEIEVEGRLADRRATIKILGVDPFRYSQLQPAFARQGTGEEPALDLLNPNTVFLSASAARQFDLTAGDELPIQVGVEVLSFEIAGVLPPSVIREPAAVLDIATAQWRFERLGRLSRISLRLRSGAAPAQVRAAITDLNADLKVSTPGEASDDALRLSRAYRANLTALALVALFTGGFFVYSTQALIALRRRREFAILHALGLTRWEQLRLNLGASAALGLIGSLLGVLLGVVLANFGLQSLGETIGVGYFSEATPRLNLRVGEILVFCAIGVAVAVFGALRPALDASQVSTASALKASDVLSAHSQTNPVMLSILFLVAILVLTLPPIAGLPLPGYVSIAILLIAAVGAIPAVIRTVLRLVPTFQRPTYEIALAEVSGTARYAALSVSAIVVSFSLMVAMAIMVTSFRASLDAWTERMLPADLYLRVGYVGQSAHLDEAIARSLAAVPGVRAAQFSRLAQASVGPTHERVVLIARSFDADAVQESLWVTEEAERSVPPGATPIWVSEAAADLLEVKAGELRDLRIADRTVTAFVQGLWRDYEHQNGAVLIERDAYVRTSGDQAINTVWFWISEATSTQSVREALVEKLPANIQYDIREPRELRELSLRVFDRTFAITYVLELVAVVIGLFGIAAGISAQVLSRRGEFGALRYIGFTRAQIGRMLAMEGSALGAIGVIVGFAMGVIVSLILIYVVNRQSFHWSMDIHVPFALLIGLAAALVGSSAIIAMSSGRQAMSADVVRAVKEDW